MAIVVMKRASDVISAIVPGSCAHAHRPLHLLEMLANYLMLLLSLSWFFVVLFVSSFFFRGMHGSKKRKGQGSSKRSKVMAKMKEKSKK